MREGEKKPLTYLFNFEFRQQTLFNYNIFKDIHAITNKALQEQLLKQLPAIQFVNMQN